jgi:hypothetical protein
VRRPNGTSRGAVPGTLKWHDVGSIRSILTSPSAMWSTTSEIWSLSPRRLVIGTLRRLSSQAIKSVATGLPGLNSTEPPVTLPVDWSSAAASRARQGVQRVHERSVSPGV